MGTGKAFLYLDEKDDEFSPVFNQWNVAGSINEGGPMMRENRNSPY